MNQLLAKTFPNTTFYSAVGNHEAGITITLLSLFVHVSILSAIYSTF
jgi:hypothetical protein